MKNTRVVVAVKNEEPGLLALTGGEATSLVPVFGGVRVIDFFVAPFLGGSWGEIHVLAGAGMHAVKDHLVFTYPPGEIRVAAGEDLWSALAGTGSLRGAGNTLLLRAEGMLFADWETAGEQLKELPPGVYPLTMDGAPLGFFLSRRRLPCEPVPEVSPDDADRVWEVLDERLRGQAAGKAVAVAGVRHPLATVWEYFKAHMHILDNLERYLPRFLALSGDGRLRGGRNAATSRIAKTGMVQDSYIPHSCTVQGEVVHTVLFPRVRIARNARVENSIILGQNHLAEGSMVVNAILCGSSARVSPTVGEGARIGGNEQSGQNEEYPDALHGGITLIGPSVEIPRGCRIAGNCYVGPGVDRALLKNRRLIRSGSSITAPGPRESG
jgi:ADP-glucose pyrophosphorylase